MVRVGGLQYTIDPAGSMGSRISEMRLNGELLDANKTYRVAGWAPVSEDAKNVGGEPIWEACGGGHCVRDHSGAVALARLKLVRKASPSRSQAPAPPNA
jgi:hypothetical protein